MNGAYVTERWLTLYETWLRLGIALFDINICLDKNDLSTEVPQVSRCTENVLLKIMQFEKSFK
jgi:hypothetical protein